MGTAVRRGDDGSPPVLVVCNFTPVPRHDYRIGVPEGGAWMELINTDAADYGGSGIGNLGTVRPAATAGPTPWSSTCPHSAR